VAGQPDKRKRKEFFSFFEDVFLVLYSNLYCQLALSDIGDADVMIVKSSCIRFTGYVCRLLQSEF
jgi:hypothetical protein